jgi:acetyl coenzyme A synthetase (ADP forming)-like protein
VRTLWFLRNRIRADTEPLTPALSHARSVEILAERTDVVDVILRDGGTLRLRAPESTDADALTAFFAHLSVESMHRRFHGRRRVDRSLIEHFLVSSPDRRVLVGLAATADGERIVAVAEYARLRNPSVAEVAFAVADDLQGHGIGPRLLERLAVVAAGAGVEKFVAEVLPENRAMLRVFADAGFDISRQVGGGEVEVRFSIAPTAAFRARVDERDHVAVAASLQPFFEPRSVAVIGASRRRGSIGGELFRNILAADFAGAAYAVNREGEPVAGVQASTSISEIGVPVDLAVICLPAAHVEEAARAALVAGVRALCVISSGFAEVGRDGAARQERLLALVGSYGARLIGPNCLGIAVPGIGLNATFAPRALPPGRIAFSSQSGALGLALLEKAAERNLGFSAFVSVGNKADVSSNDLLEWWEDDDATDLVLLYLESFGNPRKFGRLAGRVARRKPILALKAGTTRAGARAASSHTAALAGSETAIDALFRQAGVLRASTLEELVDAATLLSNQPLPRGRRVALVSNAGGLGILCADACEAGGLELEPLGEDTRERLRAILPADASVTNPVDLLGSATATTYESALPLVLADPAIDSVIVLFVPPVVAIADDVAAAVIRAAGDGDGSKPVLAVVVSCDGIPPALREAGCPVAAFIYPESAARALALAAERGDWLRREAGTVLAVDGIDRAGARGLIDSVADERWLDPAETRALLAAYGIPLVAERSAATVAEAVAAARDLGFPVVVKSAVAGAHKTESGGVALGLASAEEVGAAALRIGAPVLVQPMISHGVELLAGVVQDPVFGPLVAFGPGGVLAELIGDTHFAIAPLTEVDADELVHGGKAGRLVAGFRGGPPADAAALSDLIQRLARLAEDNPEVAELDLNPVLGLRDGCIAVDARVRVDRRARRTDRKSW